MNLAPNISVNTDRCKRRFAPRATAGYFNRYAEKAPGAPPYIKVEVLNGN